MIELLRAFLPPWLNPCLLGGLAASVAAGLGAAWLTHRLDQAPVLEAQKATMAVQARYDGYRTGVLANVAAANAKVAQNMAAAARRESELQAQLQTAQRDRDAKSRQLLQILHGAKPGEASPVGPAASRYYDSLRQP